MFNIFFVVVILILVLYLSRAND